LAQDTLANPLVWLANYDSKPLAKELKRRGISHIESPLFAVRFLKPPPDLAQNLSQNLSQCEAVIFTSSNAIRAFCNLTNARPPAFTVGSVSGALAKQEGFANVTIGGGDVVKLATLIKRKLKPTRLFYAAALHTAADIAKLLPEFNITKNVLYEAKAAESLPTSLVQKMPHITHVVLYSPRTARVFNEVTAKLEVSHLTALCLSKAVAQEVKATAKTMVSNSQESLLSLI